MIHRRFFSKLIEVTSEVASAIKNGEPVVALESTIITHGMPFPRNLVVARQVEAAVREKGAIPATVAVTGGRIRVGLSEEDLTHLATSSQSGKVIKISRRDFPYVLSQGLDGGTTVSGTMIVAHQIGIPIFVTGGIGGVHRGGESTMDVSADLTELGKTPIAVVSAGIKSILDIGRTLEYLETQGVCVGVLGSNTDFPSFFTSKSDFRAPYNFKTTVEAAEVIRSRDLLGIDSGILIGVPVPKECEAQGEVIEAAILQSLREAKERNVSGKDVTPFILSRVNELTDGESLKANVSLIVNNARIGAQIASDYASIKNKDPIVCPIQSNKRRQPIVIGGSNADLTITLEEDSVLKTDGSTHPGKIRPIRPGGVGRNVAQGLQLLGLDPFFVSVVGDDTYGHLIRSEFTSEAISVLPNSATATYAVISYKNGDVVSGIGDMEIHDRIDPRMISKAPFQHSPLVVMDGNIPVNSMEFIKDECIRSGVPLVFEPTDVGKAGKPFENLTNASAMTYSFPNYAELRRFLPFAGKKQNENKLIDCVDLSHEVLKFLKVLVVTLGSDGVVVLRRGRKHEPLPLINDPDCKSTGDFLISAVHYRPLRKIENAISASGAGDCFTAGFLSAILKGCSQDVAVGVGLQLAQKSLNSIQAVPKDFEMGIDWNLSASGTDIL